MVGVVAVWAEIMVQGELAAVTWVVFIVIPGARKPVDLAHSGEPHGLFHGEVIVMVEPRVMGVGLWYHGVSIQVWMHTGVGLCGMKMVVYWSQLAFQVESIVV